MTTGLTTIDVTTTYGNVVALEHLSLTLQPGRVLCLLGANGAGKSTTLKSIGGLARLRSGSISVDGTEISAAPAHMRVRVGVAHVPEGRALFGSLTVRDNLVLGAYRLPHRQRGRALSEIEALFPVLRARATQPAGLLSGGEGQLLSIARALMSRPKYVLMDEPSLGLSPSAVNSVMSVIRSLADSGIGILLAEQAAQQAMEIADDIAVLERGVLVKSGPASEVGGLASLTTNYLGE